MASIFRFKQFSVDQGNCAMKINTDGVLLGGIARADQARRILDIGTGTGVIALMLAQSHPQAMIDAVEIDAGAAAQASTNFENTAFADRLRLITGSFVDMQPTDNYDMIVSNPPFYTNSLPNPDPRKKLAKHTDHFFFENLLDFVARYLSGNGRFLCILPTALGDYFVSDMLPSRRLYVQEELLIRSYPGELPIRKLITIGRQQILPECTDFYIYESKGVYSERYRAILKPYFLAF